MKALYVAAVAAVLGFVATCQAEDKKVSPLSYKMKDIDGRSTTCPSSRARWCSS